MFELHFSNTLKYPYQLYW